MLCSKSRHKPADAGWSRWNCGFREEKTGDQMLDLWAEWGVFHYYKKQTLRSQTPESFVKSAVSALLAGDWVALLQREAAVLGGCWPRSSQRLALAIWLGKKLSKAWQYIPGVWAFRSLRQEDSKHQEFEDRLDHVVGLRPALTI